jgi:hypothetical protein
MRRRTHLVVVMVVIAAGCTGNPPSTSEAFPRLWVMQGGWVRSVISDDPRIASELLLKPPSVVLGWIPGSKPFVATSFAFPSARRFARNFARSRYWFRGFTSVLYDPEAWDATPPREQRNPVAAIRRFAAIAHEHGFRVIATPHQSLTTVVNARCAASQGETPTDAFLRCDLMGRFATYADVVETQAQTFQSEPGNYRDYVAACVEQARAANPDVSVISGLSARGSVTSGQMYAAWDSVRDLVDGYYLSIQDDDHVPVALAFLRMVDRERSALSSG